MTTIPQRRTLSGVLPRLRSRPGVSLAIAAAAMALAAPAAKASSCGGAPVCDGPGILPTFDAAANGAAGPDLDVLSANAFYDSSNVYLSATLAGKPGATAGGFYVWGVDTGSAIDFFKAEHDHPMFGDTSKPDPLVGVGVDFDTFIVLTPGVDGGTVNYFSGAPHQNLAPGAFTIDGDTINAVIPLSFLTASHGDDISRFGFNIWPRLGGFRNDQVTDFAPDDRNFFAAAVPEPATWAMMIIGFGGVGSVLRRRRPIQMA